MIDPIGYLVQTWPLVMAMLGILGVFMVIIWILARFRG